MQMFEESRVIPKEIKNVMDKEFLNMFYSEVVGKFKKNDERLGRELFNYEEESYLTWWMFITGTIGYGEAFIEACSKKDYENVRDYYISLSPSQRDLFDEEVCMLLVKNAVIAMGDEE